MQFRKTEQNRRYRSRVLWFAGPIGEAHLASRDTESGSPHRSTVVGVVLSRQSDQRCSDLSSTVTEGKTVLPTLYVFNASAINKPHAVEQLSADFTNHQVDIAVVSETS